MHHFNFSGLDAFAMIGGRSSSSNIFSDIEMRWLSPSSYGTGPDVTTACSLNNPPLIPDLPVTLYALTAVVFKEKFIYVIGGKVDFNTETGSEKNMYIQN